MNVFDYFNLEQSGDVFVKMFKIRKLWDMMK